MNKMKNYTIQQQQQIRSSKGNNLWSKKSGQLQLSSQRRMKKKDRKRAKKEYENYSIPVEKKNLSITGVLEEKRVVKGTESLAKEIMAMNFPNLMRDLDTQVHVAHQSLQNFSLKPSSPRHTIIKLSNIKDKVRIFKAARREKILTWKGTLIKLLMGSLAETGESGQARREWDEIFNVLKEKNIHHEYFIKNKYIYKSI